MREREKRVREREEREKGEREIGFRGSIYAAAMQVSYSANQN